jgi:hypothetical protein
MSLLQPVEIVGPVQRLSPIQDEGDLFDPARSQAGAIGEVDVSALAPGTTVIVETANSRYEMTLQDEPGVATMQGGTTLADLTPVRIVGSIGSGVGRIIGVIAVGLRLEVVADGKRILTSRVRRITVGPDRARR